MCARSLLLQRYRFEEFMPLAGTRGPGRHETERRLNGHWMVGPRLFGQPSACAELAADRGWRIDPARSFA